METAFPSELGRGRHTAGTTVSRIVSIDIFRGLTMAVMIFVNELAGVRGMPWWTEHAPARADVMTYVDMVFPFFLFAVGMSLPLSIAQRLKRNPSLGALWLHILTRALSLLGLGLILANAEKVAPALTGMSGSLWGLLGLLCASLYLGVYPKSERWKIASQVLSGVGLAGALVLFAIFRRTTAGGQVAWIDFSYPEILGLIGYSYFAAALLYIPTRRWVWAPYAWFAMSVAWCALTTAHIVTFPGHLPFYFWPFGNGAMWGLIIAGVAVSSMFVDPARPIAWPRAMWSALGFGVLALVAGWLLMPLGISKIRATPTWVLWSVGAATLLFALLYWVCDRKRWKQWATFVHPAGSNTLLTYLLPDFWYFLMGVAGITWLDSHFNAGWPGVARTVVFTLLMLAISGILTRAKVRLQL